MPRLRSSPALFTLAVILVFVVLGLADRHVDLTGQVGLGFATWLVLLAALRPLPLERRVQTLLVVGVATCMEVVGSILWGVYTYRLHNLPLFVPPGHGLVYLAGISLSETRLVRARPRWFVVAVAACAATSGGFGSSSRRSLSASRQAGGVRAIVNASRGKRSKASFADHDAEIIGASSRSIRAPYGLRSPCRTARKSRTASAANRALSSAS